MINNNNHKYITDGTDSNMKLLPNQYTHGTDIIINTRKPKCCCFIATPNCVFCVTLNFIIVFLIGLFYTLYKLRVGGYIV